MRPLQASSLFPAKPISATEALPQSFPRITPSRSFKLRSRRIHRAACKRSPLHQPPARPTSPSSDHLDLSQAAHPRVASFLRISRPTALLTNLYTTRPPIRTFQTTSPNDDASPERQDGFIEAPAWASTALARPSAPADSALRQQDCWWERVEVQDRGKGGDWMAARSVGAGEFAQPRAWAERRLHHEERHAHHRPHSPAFVADISDSDGGAALVSLLLRCR